MGRRTRYIGRACPLYLSSLAQPPAARRNRAVAARGWVHGGSAELEGAGQKHVSRLALKVFDKKPCGSGSGERRPERGYYRSAGVWRVHETRLRAGVEACLVQLTTSGRGRQRMNQPDSPVVQSPAGVAHPLRSRTVHIREMKRRLAPNRRRLDACARRYFGR